MQIYIGNLPETFTDAELRALFEPFGKVRAASIGKEKGYGFIEMAVKSEARTAIEALRGKEVAGKPLRVRALKPGDEFHQHARSLHASGKPGGVSFNAGRQPRGMGAIRRGGQRGS
jgi:RNA recognition motif-containing protein